MPFSLFFKQRAGVEYCECVCVCVVWLRMFDYLCYSVTYKLMVGNKTQDISLFSNNIQFWQQSRIFFILNEE